VQNEITHGTMMVIFFYGSKRKEWNLKLVLA
jgi:hypothetical protein